MSNNNLNTTSNNNKRIAKNTLLLYIRMFFIMAISLYTSRVILSVLGVEDYGIYNVVGGVVAMFGFLNSSLSAASQRFITFSLGEDNIIKTNKIFNTSLLIHGLLSLLIFVLAETIGLWFLWNKMQIPENRMVASFWVYQASILTAMIVIMSVPYNAVIVAHERMSAFAYISVLEIILKLVIVYLLLVISADKLIIYSLLIVAVQLIIQTSYRLYCRKHFGETRFKIIFDRLLIKEMLGFAGWNIFGACAYIAFTQGLNIILNLFFGPAINAARAIAVQVQGAIVQFVSNFQMALNPQIIKSYAGRNYDYMHALLERSAKFSFFLIFMVSTPILLEASYILELWLKTVPESTVIFTRLIVCTSWLTALSNPLINAVQATGKIKKYQSSIGSLLIMILPISYLCLWMGLPAYSVFIVHLLIEIIAQLARLIILKPLIQLSISSYFKNVVLVVCSVIVLSTLVPFYLHTQLDQGLMRLVVVSLCSLVCSITLIWYIGFNSSEKVHVVQIVKSKFCRNK